MVRFSRLAESKTLPDLLDIKSEIKWMQVLKSISPKKNFFLGSLPQVKSVQSALSDLKRSPERLQSQCNYRPFIT